MVGKHARNNASRSRAAVRSKHVDWPALDYDLWKETYQTLHRWIQIIGKLRTCKSEWVNHSWNSTFYLTPYGLTTSAIADGARSFSVDFDFCAHQLIFQTSEGKRLVLPLKSESVASFYKKVMGALAYFEIAAAFDPHPNELPDAVAFFEDRIHQTYVPSQAYNFWQVMVRISPVFKLFRSDFIGKCSPVHFFWGGFDLAVTRFSGRTAPLHPGGVPHLSDKIVRDAYSHEVSSCGFWPGNEIYPHAAFYSYAYPEPKGLKDYLIEPDSAFYHPDLQEFILPYDLVRSTASPETELMRFLKTTYRAAADLGKWNREALEDSPYLSELKSGRFINKI